MPEHKLELIVAADVTAGGIQLAEGQPSQPGELALELLRKVLFTARHTTATDGIILLGTEASEKSGDLQPDPQAVYSELAETNLPFFTNPLAPGHEQGPDRPRCGPETLGPAALYFFDDGEYSGRTEEDRSRFLNFARSTSLPLITLQNSPLHPQLDAATPVREGMRDCEQAGVVLSISTHHRYLAPQTKNGVTYVTCPQLGRYPFSFLHVRLAGSEIEVEELTLAPPAFSQFSDLHVHTPHSYCAKNMTIEKAEERARIFGLKRLVLTEHSGQLYADADDYWSGTIHKNPEMMRRAREQGIDRLQDFQQEAHAHRSDFIYAGLEVDCSLEGTPLLLPEDRSGWDVLLGSVHKFPNRMEMSRSEACAAFIQLHRRFFSFQLIDVLAHPFRIFRSMKRGVPEELFAPMADLLAESGVAAELNFHINQPDPAFFQLCLEKGVKIGLGSDAHHLYEVGRFLPHLRFLKDLGVQEKDMAQVLYPL